PGVQSRFCEDAERNLHGSVCSDGQFCGLPDHGASVAGSDLAASAPARSAAGSGHASQSCAPVVLSPHSTIVRLFGRRYTVSRSRRVDPNSSTTYDGVVAVFAGSPRARSEFERWELRLPQVAERVVWHWSEAVYRVSAESVRKLASAHPLGDVSPEEGYRVKI